MDDTLQLFHKLELKCNELENQIKRQSEHILELEKTVNDLKVNKTSVNETMITRKHLLEVVTEKLDVNNKELAKQHVILEEHNDRLKEFRTILKTLQWFYYGIGALIPIISVILMAIKHFFNFF